MRLWIRSAAVRAVKTIAQAGIAAIGTKTVLGDVDWIAVLGIALTAGVLSILTSLAGLPEVETQSPRGRHAQTPEG
jgi:hypothetical protein